MSAGRGTTDSGERDGSQLREQLRQLLTNEDLPAAARVNAARTLAELQGLIGRHQEAPDKTGTAALGSLSREDLTAELDRLRTLFGMGLLR